jgi:hypothetical protein
MLKKDSFVEKDWILKKRLDVKILLVHKKKIGSLEKVWILE